MTNEELDRARVDEAMRLWDGSKGSLAVIAARLAREGWTPPKVVDPDIAEAETLWGIWLNAYETPFKLAIKAIKKGRELERQEAKPGLVWVKHDGSKYCPAPLGVWVTTRVTTRVNGGGYVYYSTQMATDSNWRWVTHYAIITPPEEDAA